MTDIRHSYIDPNMLFPHSRDLDLELGLDLHGSRSSGSKVMMQFKRPWEVFDLTFFDSFVPA